MSRKTPGEVRARTCGTKSPSRSEALRFIDSSKSPSTEDGNLDESIKRSASDRLGDLVPQVRARTSPGVFRDMALLGLCLELSFSYAAEFESQNLSRRLLSHFVGSREPSVAKLSEKFVLFPDACASVRRLGDLVPQIWCRKSVRRFGAAGSSPDFSRGFSRHGAPRPLS